MKRLIASALALAVVAAFAAPVAAQTAAAPFAGKWTGPITMDGQDGGPAEFNLTQKGKALTGTAGPVGQQWPISKGVVTGAKATFEVQQPNGPLFKFTTSIVKGHLIGDGSAVAPGGGAARVVKFDATKAAPAAKK